MAIEFRRIFRSFGKVQAVRDISFSVPAGSVCGYIGPNGAGKTTSMRILATLDLPNYGDALVDGFSSINDPDRVRKRLGFMPDGFGAYAYTSVTEYLDFFGRAYGLIGRQREHRLRYVLDFTKLSAIADKSVHGLSKGMRQRLCLGRAMIHDPSVLVLDEPANGLDPRARIELRQMIRTLAAEGKAVLVSSHILTELAEMCDSVAIVERGELLTFGTVEEIRQRALPHRRCRVRVSGDVDEARRWLTGRFEDCQWQESDQTFRFRVQGSDREQTAILDELVRAGIKVCEFSNEEHSLEDIFMRITQGLLQ
jgi:ABC-2 type transport system ATP-binding protein